MANLLRFLATLATDAAERDRFRAAPDEAVTVLGDDVYGPLTGADIEVALGLVGASIGMDDDTVSDLLATVGRRHELEPEGAVTRLLAVCDRLDLLAEARAANEVHLEVAPDDEIDDPDAQATVREAGGAPVPNRPPGFDRHLWAVTGGWTADLVEIDPDHPSAQSAPPTLAPVPEPEGGFRPGVLDPVLLPRGIPEAGIEPGAVATVVSAVDDPPGYEVEVSDPMLGRRFLGVVPAEDVASLRAP